VDLARDNARVVREIASHFRGYAGVIVVVTNPVDVLTYEVAVTSGLPHERVIGTGTMLDTRRDSPARPPRPAAMTTASVARISSRDT
jgi:L-lactate dehydrogenase